MTQQAQKTAASMSSDQQTHNYTLPRDPNAAILEMMRTIDALREVMLAEIESGKNTDTAGFLALQDRKISVGRDFEAGMSQLLSRREELRAADPALRARLHALQTRFHETAMINRDSLDRMRRGMERLGDRIMRFARRTAEQQNRLVYGANGHMQGSERASMGINESA